VVTITTRLAVLWCPHWPAAAATEASGHDPPEPLAVLHANRVVAVSRAGVQAGVAVGMRRRQAQARCPALRVVAADPAHESRQFDPVVAAIGELVPRVELTDPGMITFVARGPARYFGGEQAMAERVVALANAALGPARVAAVGGFGVGIADGRFAATIAARAAVRTSSRVVTVPAGGSATAAYLGALPVRALTVFPGGAVSGIDDDLLGLFTRLGLTRLVDLAGMPPADVLARFGRPGRLAHQLAGGGDPLPADVSDPPPGSSVQQPFDEPVHQLDTVVFVARRLADELVAMLSADGRVCTRLAVIAETDHGERSERLWYRPEGLSAAAMVERVRWQLDAWAQQAVLTAGVTLLRLEPEQLRADDGVQLGLWGGRSQADEWAQRAVARLAALAGEQQVLVPAAGSGRHPGEAYRWTPAVTADLDRPDARLAHAEGPWPGRLPCPSPAVLVDPPERVEVLDHHGVVVRVSGRGTVSAPPATVHRQGRSAAVQAWAGPWPLDERWWDPPRARRLARFQVLTDDGVLRLLAVEHQQWWVQAVYG
jgi:protein ImuB